MALTGAYMPKWRHIVFASSLRLNLRIFGTHGTPVRESLGIWPPFPIIIEYHDWIPDQPIAPEDEDNVIAHSNTSILYIILALQVTGSQLEKFATVMQGPLPVLIDLGITSFCRNVPALPTEFLGGSAPCLQRIYLRGIPFLGLPMLLLSASDLIFLYLHDIPPTSYISPEAMVVGLAALPRLNEFVIKFQSATHHPDQVQLPPTADCFSCSHTLSIQGC